MPSAMYSNYFMLEPAASQSTSSYINEATARRVSSSIMRPSLRQHFHFRRQQLSVGASTGKDVGCVGGRARRRQRQDRGKTRQDDETDAVCDRSSPDRKVAGSFVGMRCDSRMSCSRRVRHFFIVGSPSSLIQGIKFFFLVIFKFFFRLILSIPGSPLFNHRRGWA